MRRLVHAARMAIVKPPVTTAPATLPISEEARLICEDRKHRARLRQYAHAGGLRRQLHVLPDLTDLGLSAAGYIERVATPYPDKASVVYRITREGEVRLFAWTQERRENNAGHHTLGEDLAAWLRKYRNRTTWENVQFEFRSKTPIALPASLSPAIGDGCTLRPDVFSLVSTLEVDNMVPQIFEVKVSRADFLRDVADPTKRAAYFRMAPQVFYAAPQGMLKKDEIPTECGLVEQIGPGLWKTTKNAPKLKAWPGLSPRQWMALVLKPHRSPSTEACPDPDPTL